MKFLRRLTRIQRITLILFVIVVTNWVIVSLTGYSLLGGDLFTIFLLAFILLVSITLIPSVRQKVLWRVRNRLFLTYFLIGAVPVILLCLIGAIGFYALTGSTVSYLVRSELNHRLDQLEESALQLAQDIAGGRRSPTVEGFLSPVIIRIGNRVIRSTGGPIPSIPDWSRPGFKGVVSNQARGYFLVADVESKGGGKDVEVFAYSIFDESVFASLVPGTARLRLYRIRDFASEELDPDVPAIMDSARVDSRMAFTWGSLGGIPLEVRSLETGSNDRHLIAVTARPSFVVDRLLSPLGSAAPVVIISALAILGVLLLVEFIAIVSSIALTRTLTRTIHDLHVGTKKIESGDLSHQIPIRTKDQLSELASSFNSMTGQIGRLIVEVKEKEKLQAELEIARQVQAQLFPKEIPRLQTLELAGVCKPALVVSGDYYDFIPIDARSTALVIGDISGKGISAALLMASLQSSLHAQLTIGMSGSLSTALLVSRLNRQLYDSTPPEKYATFYCGVYDDGSGRLLYTNAGHLPPILIRGSKVMRLETNGMVVGMFPESPYEQNTLELQPGDLLTAFTDGITESENSRGEQFGEARLTDLLLRYRDKPLNEIVQAVTSTVSDWAKDLQNQDDTTILVARRI